MEHPRFWRILATAFVLLGMSQAVWTAPGFAQTKKGTEDASKAPDVQTAEPEKPPETAENLSPADLLKSRNLKRVGTTYILVDEQQIQRSLSAARAQLVQFRQAAAQQNAFEAGNQDRRAFGDQLIKQRAYLNQQLAEIDRQMPSADLARTNAAVNLARNDLVNQHNQLIATINEISDRLQLIQNQGDGAEFKGKMGQEVARLRESYIQAILDVRQSIDEARKSYEELAKDPEVAKAIQALNDQSKAKVKLGPSREFQTIAANFEKTEKSVLTETVEVRKQGGVFWIDVTINGKITKPMIFDTGASLISISSAFAAEIGIRPKPSDPTIKCETADGSVVEAKQVKIGSMRVGKFTVKDVVCAVMPPEKGDVPPLLGQTFYRHFTYRFTPEAGRLTISQVDEGDARPATTTRSQPKAKSRTTKRTTRLQPRENFDFPAEETP